MNWQLKAKLESGDCLDVRAIGTEVEPGVFELSRFVEDVDYADAHTETWIWSIGKRLSDGKYFAAVDGRFYQNAQYECVWLR